MRAKPAPQRARGRGAARTVLLWACAGLLIAGLGWWWWPDAQAAAASSTSTAATTPASTHAGMQMLAAQAAPTSPMLDPAERARQLALWQERLERARATLASYQAGTRYPHESRPIAEHADQTYPNRPIEEERALHSASGEVDPTVLLRTAQSRVFVAGGETVSFSLQARDANGAVLPLQVMRATAQGLPGSAVRNPLPQMPLSFADKGVAGDMTAADGMLSALLVPSMSVFRSFDGPIRLEVHYRVGERDGFHVFDIFYTAEPPASWTGQIVDTVEAGSLNFYLQAEVRQPGRYLVSARLDDANGTPFALLSFNDLLPAGKQAIKLSLFGKLIRDEAPVFPLSLRDVDAFLLKENVTPDRAMLPRLVGRVHTSKRYAPGVFSSAEWTSEERERYLKEYGKDVDEAQQHVDLLQGKALCSAEDAAAGRCSAASS